MSDGLIAPVNAPAAPGTPVGVQPGTSQIVIAHLIIVAGSAGGLFVYSGTPGPGNGPIFWATSAGTDPYGNAVTPTAGVAGTGMFSAGDTIINAAGTFAYSGTPALGNLISSSATAAGTDTFGNPYLVGETAYSGPVTVNGNVACQVDAGNLVFYYSAASAWVAQVSFNLVLNGSGAQQLQIASGAQPIAVTNDVVAALGKQFRAATDSQGLVPATWQSMSPLTGSFAAGVPPPFYVLTGTGTVRISGTVILPAGTYNAVTFYTMAAPYIPAGLVRWPVIPLAGTVFGNASFPGFPRGYIQGAGNGAIQITGIPGSLSSASVDISGEYPLST